MGQEVSWERCPSPSRQGTAGVRGYTEPPVTVLVICYVSGPGTLGYGGGRRRRLAEGRCIRLWGKRCKLTSHLLRSSRWNLVSVRALLVVGT